MPPNTGMNSASLQAAALVVVFTCGVLVSHSLVRSSDPDWQHVLQEQTRLRTELHELRRQLLESSAAAEVATEASLRGRRRLHAAGAASLRLNAPDGTEASVHSHARAIELSVGGVTAMSLAHPRSRIHGQLAVTGSASVSSLNASGDVSTGGLASAASLRTSGDASVGGYLHVGGQMVAGAAAGVIQLGDMQSRDGSSDVVLRANDQPLVYLKSGRVGVGSEPTSASPTLSVSGGLGTTGAASVGVDAAVAGDFSWKGAVLQHSGTALYKEVTIHYPCCAPPPRRACLAALAALPPPAPRHTSPSTAQPPPQVRE